MDKAGEITKNFNITLPRNRYVDESVEKVGADYIKKIWKTCIKNLKNDKIK